MELKEKLTQLRKKHGLSQLELSEKLNVSRQAISKWEVGTTVPSIENLRALSVLYDIPVDYLLTNSNTAIVTPDCQETSESSKPTAKANWKHLALFISIFLFVGMMIFFSVYHYNEKNGSQLFVNEMETDSWNMSTFEKFSVDWSK